MVARKAPSAPLLLPDSEVEDPARVLARELEGGVVAGLDEAGRGPLAGPVVAACVVLPATLPEALCGLDDSKRLSSRRRQALFAAIEEHALAFGVASIEAHDIDRTNVLQASLFAMTQALSMCESKLGACIAGAIIDGNQRAPLPARIVQRTVVGGDRVSRPVQAASILAKVTRDRRMHAEHARWPQYGFDRHVGYGTAIHLAALKSFGPCPLHRLSFAPVRESLGPSGAS